MIIGFVIWSIASAVMLGIGIWSYRSKEPVLFLKQNSAGFVFSLLGTVIITIGLAVGYTFIERKYRV